MALIYHELNIPLDTDSTFDYIAIKQGDAGSHKVRATLINNNSVFTIPTSNATYYFKFRKPDNTYVLVQATVSNNQIIADVTEEMLRVAGTGRGEFMIIQGSTELKTATFYFKIVPQIYTTDDVISSSDFATFASLLEGAGNAASKANAAAAAANTAAENAAAKADLIPDDYTALVQQVEDIQDELENLDVETDATLTVQGKPADAKATGDAIDKINGSLRDIMTIAPVFWTVGKNIKIADGTLIANTYFASTEFIPFTGGVKVSYTGDTVDSNAVQLVCICAQFDSSFTLLSRDYLMDSSGVKTDIAIDSDCAYIRFALGRDSSTGVTMTSADTAYFGVTPTVAIPKRIYEDYWNQLTQSQSLVNLRDYGTPRRRYALLATNGKLDYDTSYTTTDYIPVSGMKKLYLNEGARYAFYNSNKAFLSTGNIASADAVYGDVKVITIPSTASYFRIAMNTSNWDNSYIYCSPVIDYIMYVIQNGTASSKVLYTIGDSITKGMYATIGSSASTGQTDYCYAYWIAQLNGYTLHNLGVSDTGYVSSEQNGPYIADNNDFADADYIMIAYGVNDYKASTAIEIGSLAESTLNDGTIVGNMRYTIETIIGKAPQAKLFIISPMNGNRILGGVETCVEADNWYMGTSVNGRTLADVKTAIKAVAEYYGIELIDLQQVGPVNRLNIRTLLGDGLHPTLAGHEMIGRTLSAFIK